MAVYSIYSRVQIVLSDVHILAGNVVISISSEGHG